MITTTSGAADLPEALRSIQRFEVVDCIDDKHIPAVIPNPHGPWVRYEDHIAALAAGRATAAPAGDWLWVKLMDFCKKRGFAPENFNDLFEIVDAARAASAPADIAQEDAALWRWLAEYLVGTRTDLDDEIVACETVNDLRKLVESAIKQGEKQ